MRKKKEKKAQPLGSTKVSMLRPTPDDWHPTLEGGFVEVRLYRRLPGGKALVCAWGGDDTGMELWFDADAAESATTLYLHLATAPFVSKRYLAALGFTFC